MNGLYQDLTADELKAKIADLTTKYETAMGGGVAIVVAGEGRRVEYTRANADGLMSLINAAQRQLDRLNGVRVDGALPISFPYAGNYYGR